MCKVLQSQTCMLCNDLLHIPARPAPQSCPREAARTLPAAPPAVRSRRAAPPGCRESGGEWWSGVERSGAEWSGVERRGAERSGEERRGAERSGEERSGAERNGVEARRGRQGGCVGRAGPWHHGPVVATDSIVVSDCADANQGGGSSGGQQRTQPHEECKHSTPTRPRPCLRQQSQPHHEVRKHLQHNQRYAYAEDGQVGRLVP